MVECKLTIKNTFLSISSTPSNRPRSSSDPGRPLEVDVRADVTPPLPSADEELTTTPCEQPCEHRRQSQPVELPAACSDLDDPPTPRLRGPALPIPNWKKQVQRGGAAVKTVTAAAATAARPAFSDLEDPPTPRCKGGAHGFDDVKDARLSFYDHVPDWQEDDVAVDVQQQPGWTYGTHSQQQLEALNLYQNHEQIAAATEHARLANQNSLLVEQNRLLMERIHLANAACTVPMNAQSAQNGGTWMVPPGCFALPMQMLPYSYSGMVPAGCRSDMVERTANVGRVGSIGASGEVFASVPLECVRSTLPAQPKEVERKVERKLGKHGGACQTRSSSIVSEAVTLATASGDASSATSVSEDAPELQTTVMLRNIPNNYNRNKLLTMLDDNGFAAAYDFLYLPIDFTTHACLGYAFVNLVDHEVALRFWAAFDGYTNWVTPSRKSCRVDWCSPHQGLQANIERYRNSPVMHEQVPPLCQPLVFERGLPVPFPRATKKLRAPRMRGLQAGKSASAGGATTCEEFGTMEEPVVDV